MSRYTVIDAKAELRDIDGPADHLLQVRMPQLPGIRRPLHFTHMAETEADDRQAILISIMTTKSFPEYLTRAVLSGGTQGRPGGKGLKIGRARPPGDDGSVWL